MVAMEMLLIAAAAFTAAGVTLFSGFGLGTVLMPVIAIFLPVPVAIAVTAVVHLLNNLLKLWLLWQFVDRGAVIRFGVPALLAAVPGAILLDHLSVLEPVAAYRLLGRQYFITPVKVVAGILLVIFATAEIMPFPSGLSRYRLSLPLGGVLSGFFGGLSGNQGAFRSAFLIRAGLDKHAFVSTNAAIAAFVDLSRIFTYWLTFEPRLIRGQSGLILLATLSAFSGVLLGARLLNRVTLAAVRSVVAAMLYLLGFLLAAGLV